MRLRDCMAAVFLATLPIGGCAAFDGVLGNDPAKVSNVQRADQSLVALDTAVKALNVLADQGYLDAATRMKAVAAAKDARAAALGMRLASVSGDDPTFDQNVSLFSRAMDDLLRAKFAAENARAFGAAPVLLVTPTGAAPATPAPRPPATPTLPAPATSTPPDIPAPAPAVAPPAAGADPDPEPAFAPPTSRGP